MAARPQDLPLRVVYEDADVIVIDKPKNMVVHPAAGNPDGTVVNALLAHCGGSLHRQRNIRKKCRKKNKIVTDTYLLIF